MRLDVIPDSEANESSVMETAKPKAATLQSENRPVQEDEELRLAGVTHKEQAVTEQVQGVH